MGVDAQRLRRRAVFERLLVRLELADPGRWVLKGGTLLEVRLGNRARATKDLDLVARDMADDGEAIRQLLADELRQDPHGDGFVFEVGQPKSLAADDAGRVAWEYSVAVSLSGSVFAQVKLDVVARESEVIGTERIALPGALNFADLPSVDVEAVDLAQHFAEKVHAMTRTYHDQPSSRVKDLPDLILLIEEGLEPSPQLAATIEHVFAERATHPFPQDLPDPPADWEPRFDELAEELDLPYKTVAEAMVVLRRFWAATLASRTTRD